MIKKKVRHRYRGSYTMADAGQAHARDQALSSMQQGRRRRVIDKNNGKCYDSIKDAAEHSGVAAATVNKMCLEKPGHDQYKGFKFRYL